MYDKVNTNLNFAEREKDIIEFWKNNKIFEKSCDLRNDCDVFTFYEGPPTANGKPHIGHVITRAVKDLIPRYKTMKGYKVLRKAGWDTHGLPVELEVEKRLSISGKPEIENYGVEPFIKKCKESVWIYENEWRDMSERVGFWVDMDDPYVTYHDNYIESEWWALKSIWDKGLLYKGHKIVPYCPRCGTALSSHEVAQGYQDVTEPSVYAKFKVKNKDEYLIVWTTTPWTLPSNVALCVNANIEYSKVKAGQDQYILASALVETVLKGIGYEVAETFKGSVLEGLEYEPLFDFISLSPGEKGFYVVCDDYVTTTDGSGIVHIAPAFGEDDNRIGKKYNLPFAQLVNEQGKFVDAVHLWTGLFVKEADPKIIENLKSTGKLFMSVPYQHSYPFCWRCDTPLLYYAREAWFIKMTALRDKLVKNNDTVNWLPENIKHGRFGNFLENVMDWALSRERYWGTPLPLWECECGHIHAVGSKEELKSLAGLSGDIELHKPYVDEVKFACQKCGKQMKRVPEVIDCWFDSGSMPFAQLHYPFENKELFEKHFPADFISEALDQTRGWFYSLMAISTLLFDQSPYKNVIVLGLVQDKDGQKMSKHKGNVVDPWDSLNKQGADAVRWYFYTNSAPWLPSRFYEEAVNEAQRRFMGTFWNTYAFYVLYAEIDQFNPYEYKSKDLNIMDKWILSRLNTLVRNVDRNLAEYKITESGREMNDFVDELSNWYVRRCRERFWVGGMPQDKINAYKTLHTVLVTLSKLAAPFIPFMTEEIYRNIVKNIDNTAPESIHFCSYPEFDDGFIDPQLEKYMDMVLKIVVQGRAARNASNIKNRQPLKMMYVKINDSLPETYIDIIKDELNVKNIAFAEDISGFISYKFKPQLKTLGPKYGKLLPKISQWLMQTDGSDLMSRLQNGTVQFSIDDTDIELSIDDVLYEIIQKEGFVTESGKGAAVVLDTNLTEELIEEGFVREIISKVQTIRKEAGFEVVDKIYLYHEGNDRIAGVMARNADTISADVLALDIMENGITEDCYAKEWDINGEAVKLAVKKQA